MPPARSLLLVCALPLLLCVRGARGAAGASPRISCYSGRCLALFTGRRNFKEAQGACGFLEGQLPERDADGTVKRLLGGLGGRYWLMASDKDKKPTPREAQCTYVTRMAGDVLEFRETRCRETLDGYLCAFKLSGNCSALQVKESEQVGYTFQDLGTLTEDLLLHGTMAEVRKPGVPGVVSRHLCVSTGWIKAPWTCEVLQGGCEHACDDTGKACKCPAGHKLRANGLDCVPDCLPSDGCLDSDECGEGRPCRGAGRECKDVKGSYKCLCQGDLEEEDGVCMDKSICLRCEHSDCRKVRGEYRCACKAGFRVSPRDPVRCEMVCSELNCPADCQDAVGQEGKHMGRCHCPEGYIWNVVNNTDVCTDIDECLEKRRCPHRCENLLGGFKCVCPEGFVPRGLHDCEPAAATAAAAADDQAPEATFMKIGSVLGITAFLAMCVALVLFLVWLWIRHCRKPDLYSFRGSDIAIFTLQQVSTETYKRLPINKSEVEPPKP